MVLKKLTGCVRQYKAQTIATPLFVALEVGLECLIPLVMARLIDSIYGKSYSPIITYGIVLLAMAAFSLLFGVLSGKFAATASCGFA